MGFFDFFKRKKNKTAVEKTEDKVPSVISESNLQNRDTREAYISGNCEVIQGAQKQMLEARKEYDVVTEYLSDIQKIDMLSQAKKEVVKELATKIINLNDERKKMQHTPSKITVAQRIAIEESEADMEEELERIVDSENYRLVVESDLRTLEGERDALDYEIDDVLGRDAFNRKIVIAATAFIILALILLILVQQMGTTKNVIPVYILIVLFGGLSAVYFLVNHKRNEQLLNDDMGQLNRAIFLLNKVKIKYVNVVNMLDYNYEKYHVESSKELKYNIKEYRRIKDEERRFKTAENLIDFHNDELKQLLRVAGLADPGIWIYQCEALVDEKEMVEVRHRLNVRRQKLRKQTDVCQDQISRAKSNIVNVMARHPEYEYEIRMIMSRYQLTID